MTLPLSAGDGAAEVWQRVVAVAPLPSAGVVLAAGAVALLLVAVPSAWRVSRHVVTVVHEAGHAVAAVLTGRRLSGIRLHSDTSGVTLSRGRARGPGMVLMVLAGYPAPAVLGLGAAALLARGYAAAVLWAVLILLALVLVVVRNLFGLWAVLVCGAAAAAVTWYAPPGVQQAVALVLCWFWLVAAPRTVVELARSRRRSRGSDADQLARLTRVPAAVWVAVLGLVTLGALVLGAGLLLPGFVDLRG